MSDGSGSGSKGLRLVLQYDVDECSGVGLPSLATVTPSHYLATLYVATTRHGVAKLLVGVLREMFQYTRMLEDELVAQLHTAEVDDSILHRLLHEAALACLLALHQCSQQTDEQVHTCIAVAQGCARLCGHVVVALPPTRGGCCTACTLCHRLESLHRGKGRIVVEALDGAVDDARIDLMYLFPRETQLGHGSRVQVLHEDVGRLEQLGQDLLALGRLHVQLDGAFVAVELQVVEAIHVGIVEQLGSCGVAHTYTFNLYHIGAEPRQHLCTRWSRLHLSPVDYLDTLQWCCHISNSPCC